MRENSANCSCITVFDWTLLMRPLQVCIRVKLPFCEALSCASPMVLWRSILSLVYSYFFSDARTLYCIFLSLLENRSYLPNASSPKKVSVLPFYLLINKYLLSALFLRTIFHQTLRFPFKFFYKIKDFQQQCRDCKLNPFSLHSVTALSL